MPGVWWCSQKDWWPIEHRHQVVACTRNDGVEMRYYEFVGWVEKGDLVVHFVEPNIVAVSRAEEDGSYRHEWPILDGHDYGPGWRFRSEYFILEAPIHRRRVASSLVA